MKKIGLFGGSFDPVHLGHLELAKKVLKTCDLDEIWFIMAYDQPFKEKHFESFENRFKLLKIALRNYPKFKAIDIEKYLDKPSYSYNTVIKLSKLYPNYSFKWIIGDDQIITLDKWYKFEQLNKLIDFIVVNRNNVNVSNDFEYVDFNNDASSTKVRNGEFKYLDYKVREAIFENEYYFSVILYNNLSKKRADHTLRCLEVSKILSKNYNVDKTSLNKAIFLHDITKELDKDIENEIMNKYYNDKLFYHQKVYHQFSASYFAKVKYQIFDNKILNAIKSHTTGDDRSLLGMLVYLSDKLEMGRHYDTSEYIKLCHKNIYKCFKKVYEDANKARGEKNIGK